ncbi:natriuretic peptides B [Trichomycterus rosablanca]|uniref:natriuretic peptides B n=1 Tax=Trichomycterus rosablanca TaxID=2290929 RepID=UPI002F3524ED
MAPIYIPSACFLLLLSLPLSSAHPLQSASLTSEDVDVLKLLLRQLEESFPTQTQVPEVVSLDDTVLPEEEVIPKLEAIARDFLSARDLKSVRQDTGSRKHSGCFGRRLDRIGSMSTLGCNIVGRNGE